MNRPSIRYLPRLFLHLRERHLRLSSLLSRYFKTEFLTELLPPYQRTLSLACNILGAILCARVPLSFSVIDALLALPQDTPSSKSVSRLRCVLHVNETEHIRILHPSFHDYLSERCGDKPWSINLEHHNKELALRCIKLLHNELRENLCDMTLPYLSQKHALPEAISYACKFWIDHVCLISTVEDDILNEIYNFLEKHLLHWMEVMAILKSHDRTIRSVDNLMKWLRVCPLICIMETFHLYFDTEIITK